MDHFLQQPYKVLCSSPGNLQNAFKKLKKSDYDDIRQLGSFKKYFDSLNEKEQTTLENSENLQVSFIKLPTLVR